MGEAAVATKVVLDPSEPERWPELGFENLYAMSWRDCVEAQTQALRLRFERLSGSIPALDKLASKEGILSIDSIEDALPLLFDHRVFKNYPLSLIETRNIPKLHAWLGRLTTHDLSAMDLTGLTTIEGWLDRLDDFGMLVTTSSGTTGKLSFVPRSRTEYPTWERVYLAMLHATTGVDPYTDPVETFAPSYRGGHQTALKVPMMFNTIAAGGAEHYHTLYQTHMSADLMSLAGRMQAAEDRGELDKLGLDPALLTARQDMIALAKRRPQDLKDWFNKLFEDYRGKRVKISGLGSDMLKTALDGRSNGIKPEFGAGSFAFYGGGLKGFKHDLPDWEAYVREFFGIERLGTCYGMSEIMGITPRCAHGNYHFQPFTIPVLFDADMKPLPREGTQTGRFGFFDLLAQTYWGGFISGDEVTMHWEEDCECGWKQPYVDPAISRYSDKEGGDDKITCAGTQKVYDDFLNFVSEG
ncbi:MAG: hypothetical protein ABIQ66_03175 [Novosphingobium sp.]